MLTIFDHISDWDILTEFQTIGMSEEYSTISSDNTVRRIAHLAYNMFRFDAWVGWPVTIFKEGTTDYDGNHRMRAVKFLARKWRRQIHVPVRFDPTMPETKVANDVP